MIGRVWRGWTTAELAPRYVAHLRDETFPALAGIDGHDGAYALRRESGGEVEFVVLTLWRSLDAVRAFAGEDYELAVIEPEALRLLSRYDDRSEHFEVVLDRA
jgi:heme-degrading monooxygenase HmoA